MTLLLSEWVYQFTWFCDFRVSCMPFWVHLNIISTANHHYLRCSCRTVIWWINDSIWLQYNCQHYPTPTHPNPAKHIWAKMHTSLQTSFWQMALSAISNHSPCSLFLELREETIGWNAQLHNLRVRMALWDSFMEWNESCKWWGKRWSTAHTDYKLGLNNVFISQETWTS